MELTVQQALQRGIAAHKENKLQDAERFYRAILQAQPNHPDANHNLGVLAVTVGRTADALLLFKNALGANPKIEQFWLSYIDALIKEQQMGDAKEMLAQAKKHGVPAETLNVLEEQLKPGTQVSETVSTPQSTTLKFSEKRKKQAESEKKKHLESASPSQQQLTSLLAHYQNGQFADAEKLAVFITQEYPKHQFAWKVLGLVLGQSGRNTEAANANQTAVALSPTDSEAHNNFGNTLKELGRLADAEASYAKAIALKPDFAEAHYNLGITLEENGRLAEAEASYAQSIALKPDFSEAHYNLGNLLKGMRFGAPKPDLQKIIMSILEYKTYVRPYEICGAAISLLKFEPAVEELLQDGSKQILEETISALSQLPLLLKLMSVTPLSDLDMEARLIDIRSKLLSSISKVTANSDLLRFQSALALQCFTNEYVYHQSDAETQALLTLELDVEKALSNGQQPNSQAILCLASYKALHDYPWCDSLTVTGDIEEVFTRQVLEPRKEEQMKPDIPVLQEITDWVSSRVREQYEQSPYPRWVDLGLRLKPAPIAKVVDEIKIKLFDHKINQVDSPEILIAGCGTGQHPIGTAARFENAVILAVDLSLSSLAYAKRKTEELGFHNITYMQSDILDLGQLNKQFDIIETSGVIHHMDDPMAGWRVLKDCLKQGGLMKMGLYSELARQHIIKMREEIEHSGDEPDSAMKSFRSEVINSAKAHHKLITQFSDFYSLSTLRDLLFHVEEHRFTVPQLKACLAELNLKFCGFENHEIVRNFKLTNTGLDDPYNLDLWDTYEKENPLIFAGMYQFWCQKEP